MVRMAEMTDLGTHGNEPATLRMERARILSKKDYRRLRNMDCAFHLLAPVKANAGTTMDGTLQIALAAVTTGSILGPGGTTLAAHPNAMAMMTVLLMAAFAFAALAAWRAATGPVRRPPPPGPALPKLRRKMQGPRERRA